MKRMDRLHPAPLPHPACFYRGDETYPERVRVSFSNGHVQTYWAEVPMPKPHLITEEERGQAYRARGGYLFRPAWAAEKVRGILKHLGGGER